MAAWTHDRPHTTPHPRGSIHGRNISQEYQLPSTSTPQPSAAIKSLYDAVDDDIHKIDDDSSDDEIHVTIERQPISNKSLGFRSTSPQPPRRMSNSSSTSSLDTPTHGIPDRLKPTIYADSIPVTALSRPSTTLTSSASTVYIPGTQNFAMLNEMISPTASSTTTTSTTPAPRRTSTRSRTRPESAPMRIRSRSNSRTRMSTAASTAQLLSSSSSSLLIHTQKQVAQYVLAGVPEYLHFASYAFPAHLILLASRIYHAKCRDIGLPAHIDKERRFVQLMCSSCMAGSDRYGAVTQESQHIRVAHMSLGLNALEIIVQTLTTPQPVSDGIYTYLNLCGNVVGDEGAPLIAHLLRTNTTLTALDMRATGMGQSGMSIIFDALRDSTSITSFNASSLKTEGRMYMGQAAARALGDVLQKNNVLRKLYLQNCGVVPESIPHLSRGLSHNRHLVCLDLSGNDLRSRSMERLADALSHVPTLTQLSLAENGMGTYGILALHHVLRKMENLKTLDLRKNYIALKGFTILSDALADMFSVQEVHLDGNFFNDINRTEWDSVLKEDLRKREEVDQLLKQLHLSDRRVSLRLSSNPQLRTLTLSQSRVSDHLLEEMCSIFASHKTLSSLSLIGNGISDAGAHSLARLLTKLPTLVYLNLNDNGITDEGGYALVSVLHESSTLSFLGMSVNNVGKNTAMTLINVMTRNKMFHCDMYGNKIPYILYTKLQDLSNRNQKQYEASSGGRYQLEVDKLKERQNHRLYIERCCVESIQLRHELEEQVAQLEASKDAFYDTEMAHTREYVEQLRQHTDTCRDIVQELEGSEHAVLNAAKDFDTKVAAMRKAIEKEQRFVAHAEIAIPQAIEQRRLAIAEEEIELSILKKEIRLEQTDRDAIWDLLTRNKAQVLLLLTQLQQKEKEERKAQEVPVKKKSRPTSGKKSRSKAPARNFVADAINRAAFYAHRKKMASEPTEDEIQFQQSLSTSKSELTLPTSAHASRPSSANHSARPQSASRGISRPTSASHSPTSTTRSRVPSAGKSRPTSANPSARSSETTSSPLQSNTKLHTASSPSLLTTKRKPSTKKTKSMKKSASQAVVTDKKTDESDPTSTSSKSTKKKKKKKVKTVAEEEEEIVLTTANLTAMVNAAYQDDTKKKKSIKKKKKITGHTVSAIAAARSQSQSEDASGKVSPRSQDMPPPQEQKGPMEEDEPTHVTHSMATSTPVMYAQDLSIPFSHTLQPRVAAVKTIEESKESGNVSSSITIQLASLSLAQNTGGV